MENYARFGPSGFGGKVAVWVSIPLENDYLSIVGEIGKASLKFKGRFSGMGFGDCTLIYEFDQLPNARAFIRVANELAIRWAQNQGKQNRVTPGVINYYELHSKMLGR